jgi:hypothetical protein
MTNMTVLTFNEVLAKHLLSHPIPIPVTMVDACNIAVKLVNNFDLKTMVELPYNVHFRRLSTWEREQSMEAFKVIAFCHLEDFLTKEALDNYNKFMYS